MNCGAALRMDDQSVAHGPSDTSTQRGGRLQISLDLRDLVEGVGCLTLELACGGEEQPRVVDNPHTFVWFRGPPGFVDPLNILD